MVIFLHYMLMDRIKTFDPHPIQEKDTVVPLCTMANPQESAELEELFATFKSAENV